MTNVDVLIIGGGIAGLWTLARLRQQGFDAFLIESSSIGGVQSIASQGIIHGGSKYALGGKLGDSAKAIGDMPRIWNDCLNGGGELDLSAVEVHTQTQLGRERSEGFVRVFSAQEREDGDVAVALDPPA